MPKARKGKHELVTCQEAGRRLDISRNGVLNRLLRKRYKTEEHGGILFVVVDAVFLADVDAADAARKAKQATEQPAAADVA